MTKVRKILIPILMIFILSLAAMAADVYPDASNIEVRGSSDYNSLVTAKSLVNQVPDPAVPGQYVEVRFKVENIGGVNANKVQFKIEPKYPFSLDTSDKIKKLGNVDVDQIGNDAYVVYYKLRVDKDAIEGTTAIDAYFSTDNGNTWQEAGPFAVRIQERDALLSIASVETVPEKIQQGQEATVNIKLKNNAQTLLTDIRANLEFYKETALTTSISTTERPFTPIDSSSEKTIKQLDKGEEAVLSFRIITDSDAQSQVYKVPLSLQYTDNKGKNYTKSGIIGLVVDEDVDYLLNIEKSTLYTTGSKGTVTISLSNIGHGGINFVTMYLDDTEDYKVLSPKQVYLGNIDSDDFESAEYEIYACCNKKDVPLNLTVVYKDNYNNKETVNHYGDLVLPVYSAAEAKRFGLVPSGNIAGSLISLIILVVLVVFWLFMVMDCLKTKRTRYKKILWCVMVIGGFVIGAAIYYFVGRKKE